MADIDSLLISAADSAMDSRNSCSLVPKWL